MANWIERLNAAGVPCGEINDIQQVFESPQVAHLGLAQPVKSHERGDTHLVGQPITMSRTPSTIASPPPMAGEHNQEVLTDLGFTADDIETLKRDGVI